MHGRQVLADRPVLFPRRSLHIHNLLSIQRHSWRRLLRDDTSVNSGIMKVRVTVVKIAAAGGRGRGHRRRRPAVQGPREAVLPAEAVPRSLGHPLLPIAIAAGSQCILIRLSPLTRRLLDGGETIVGCSRSQGGGSREGDCINAGVMRPLAG